MSSVNRLFDPAINKLYFIPKWVVSGVVGVGVLCNSECLGIGESDVLVMLLNSVLHRSSKLTDVNLAGSTTSLGRTTTCKYYQVTIIDN